MSTLRKNDNPMLKAARLFALTFLVLLNARGDVPSPEDQAPKLSPEQRDAAKKFGEELQREYNMAIKSPEGASQFQATIGKAITNIDAASKPAGSNGNNLPASFTELFYPKQQNVSANNPTTGVSVLKSGFMGLNADNFSDQYTLVWAAQLINTAPEILMPILQERAKVFPPTVVDYILYEYVLMALGDNHYFMTGGQAIGNDPPDVPLSRCVGLLTLAQAKNPIYRLLAVKAAPLVEPDENKRVNFYSTFLNEPDPTVQNQAMFWTAQTKVPATISILQSFQKAAQQNGNTEGADAAQKAIQRLSNK